MLPRDIMSTVLFCDATHSCVLGSQEVSHIISKEGGALNAALRLS